MKRATLLFVALASVSLAAQSPTGFTLRIYAAGSSVMVANVLFPRSDVTCKVAKAEPVTNVSSNPTEVRWDDWSDKTKDCVVPFTPWMRGSLAPGLYEATITATATGLPDAWESGRSNLFAVGFTAPMGSITPTSIRIR